MSGWPSMNLLFCSSLFFFSSRRRHTRCLSDWSSDVCSSDLCVRYITSINEQLVVTYEERGGLGSIDFGIVGQPLCLGRHGNEYWVTSVLLHARSEERRVGKACRCRWAARR